MAFVGLLRTGTVAVFALGLLAHPPGAGADPVGAATMVEAVALRAPDGGNWTRLPLSGSVYLDDLVRSSPEGGLRVTFVDRSTLTLGAGATAVIDRFVFDPDAQSGDMVAELGTGIFRFASGALPTGQVEVRTPTALLGTRGTEFDIIVDDQGRTVVRVNSGQVRVGALNGATVRIEAGQAVFVESAGDTDLDVISSRDWAQILNRFGLTLEGLGFSAYSLPPDYLQQWDSLAAVEDAVSLAEALEDLSAEFDDQQYHEDIIQSVEEAEEQSPDPDAIQGQVDQGLEEGGYDGSGYEGGGYDGSGYEGGGYDGGGYDGGGYDGGGYDGGGYDGGGYDGGGFGN